MKISGVIFQILMLLYHASALSSDATNTTESTAQVNNTSQIFNTTKNATTTAAQKKQSGTFVIIQVLLYSIVSVIGITGNTLVLQTVSSKRMRSVKNLLIGNLAIADLTTCAVCVPMTVTTLFISWPFGQFVCTFFFPLTDVVVSVSIMTLCAISLDRFRAIVHPFTRKMSLTVTVLVTTIIWVLSFILVAVPLMKIMKIQLGIGGTMVCAPIWPSNSYKKAYRLAILMALYIAPVSLIFFCFVCIGRKIKSNMRFMRESVRDVKNIARLKKRTRVVKLMFVIFLTFTICLLPIHVLLTTMAFYPPSLKWRPLTMCFHISILILVANSCMNPIILYMMSSDFRRGFKENCLILKIAKKIRNSKRENASFYSEENHTAACMMALHHFQDSYNRKQHHRNGTNGCADILIPMYPCKNADNIDAL